MSEEEATTGIDDSNTVTDAPVAETDGPESEAGGLRARLSMSDKGLVVKASPAVALLVMLLAIVILRSRRAN